MQSEKMPLKKKTTEMSTVTFEIKTSIFSTEKQNVPLHFINKKLDCPSASIPANS